MGKAIIETGQHIARARRGIGFPFNLYFVTARRDVNAQLALERDQILIIFAE